MTPVPAAAGVLDSLDMFGATAAMPEQVAAAVEEARGLDGLPDRAYVENVVVLGMGGSGIAGDVMVAVAGPFVPVPIVVVKSYVLPDFVGRGSLVFAVSFSGDTEETVEAAGEAADAGASLVAVTAGGALGRHGRRVGDPGGQGAVRAFPSHVPGLGATAIPPLVVLEDIGLFPGATQWIALAVDQLARRRDELVQSGSFAEDLARRIGRTIPMIHGAQALGAAAALRWKTQVNENAKTPAFCGGIPRAVPQRGRRLGPKRRRDASDLHPRQSSSRRRAPPGPAALRPRDGTAARSRRRRDRGAGPGRR